MLRAGWFGRRTMIEKTIREVFAALAAQKRIAAVYLMGSAAAGTLRPDSDIDIALLPAEGCQISLDERMWLVSELTLRLGRDIDMGLIASTNLVYASEAILKGKRLLTVDQDYVAKTETRLLGCYLQFREDRRVVEEAYRAA